MLLPFRGAIAQDIGLITFDANGKVIREVGPHPIMDGPGAVKVCNALSPN